MHRAVVVAFAVPNQAEHLVAVEREVECFPNADVIERRSDFEVNHGIEPGRDLAEDEVFVLHAVLGLRLVQDGAVYVVLPRVERGKERLGLGNDDVAHLVQPRSGRKKIFGVPLEDDALSAPEFIDHERAAAVRLGSETGRLEGRPELLDNLGRHNRPGGVRHLAEGRYKRTVHLEGERVGVRRLKRRAERNRVWRGCAGDAEWKTSVWCSYCSAAPDEALLAVF